MPLTMKMNESCHQTAYGSEKNRNFELLVQQYAVLVKRIAHHLMGRMPSSICVDDMIQSGMIGLLEAAGKYDASKGASFETYAGIRIRGAMLDEIRRGDWAPRSVHRNARKVSAAIKQIENRTGSDAKDVDIAGEMGVSMAGYHSMLQDTLGTKLFSLNELTNSDDFIPGAASPASAGPFHDTQRTSFQVHLVEAISQLPEREKLVLSLYYDEELNLREIGEIIGVSESRVSQIHSQAALRLRSRLESWHDNNNESSL